MKPLSDQLYHPQGRSGEVGPEGMAGEPGPPGPPGIGKPGPPVSKTEATGPFTPAGS